MRPTSDRFADATLAKPVGSGPYVVEDATPGARLLLRRDPNYWGAEVPSQRGIYNFDEIDIQYFRDGNSLFEAFKAGLLDYREETSTTRWSSGYDFPAMRDGRVVREELKNENPKGLEGFVFNTRRSAFKDARLREAFGMMFDFEWINANLYSGLYTRTKSFFDESNLSSYGRPASEQERALLAPYPGAVRADILEGGSAPARQRRLGPRPRDGAARARTARLSRLSCSRAANSSRTAPPSHSKSWSRIATRSVWRSITPRHCRGSASTSPCASSTRFSISGAVRNSIST